MENGEFKEDEGGENCWWNGGTLLKKGWGRKECSCFVSWNRLVFTALLIYLSWLSAILLGFFPLFFLAFGVEAVEMVTIWSAVSWEIGIRDRENLMGSIYFFFLFFCETKGCMEETQVNLFKSSFTCQLLNLYLLIRS